MPSVSLSKKDVPFLLGGNGELSLGTGRLALNAPIPSDGAPILDVRFKADGEQSVALGQANTVKIGVSTSAHGRVVPIFGSSTGAARELLDSHGLGDFFADSAAAGQAVLGFDVGATAGVSAAGSFVYAPLTATATVDAGVDGGYTYLKPVARDGAIQDVVPALFRSMKLPEQLTEPPERGEAVSLRYGGYLRVGAELAAGYELAGTKAVSVGGLSLSERYRLSILGKVGLSAAIAGRFSILVTAGDLPGWARVKVTRHRAADFKVAADVTVDFDNALDGLPNDSNEFLGAVLGVNGKSFLAVLQRVRDLGSFDTVSEAIDGLAKQYIGELVGSGFDALAKQKNFATLLGSVNKVVTSYETVGDRAVTLFDRYFDRLSMLTGFMDTLGTLQAKKLDRLRGTLTPVLFDMLAQITDGDPLGFLMGSVIRNGVPVDTVAELRSRSDAVLALVKDAAHAEIRDAIATAKRGFRLDALFREAAKIDSVDGLKAIATERVGLFVTRLVGRRLDSSANVKAAFEELKEVLAKLDTFTATLYESIKEATNSAYGVAVHAEYSRATERDALVDVLINMKHAEGPAMMKLAARGDFHAALTSPDTDLVRLREGVLTHRTRHESAFKVNIVGWHLNYAYEGFDRVITESEQRFVPSDRGILIRSTTSLGVERDRKRGDEAMHVNFLLRALGESAKAVKADGRTLEYIIDTLTMLTASYTLAFTDEDTSQAELDDYLAFARDLGLDAEGAMLEKLTPVLPRAANGGFGQVTASYDVRFGPKALQALLRVNKLSAAAEASIRHGLRRIVLSNYLKSKGLHDVAFAYATPAVFTLFKKLGPEFSKVLTAREFPVAVGIGVAAPARVVLDPAELRLLETLYNIENSFIDAVTELTAMLQKPGTLTPTNFEKKLAKFGNALEKFDRFDQTTSEHGIGTSTIFAVFDSLVRLASKGDLVRLASKGDPANIGVLRLASKANGRDVEKLFMTPSAAEG
jgi:hypothetical protein